jgi:hypothetical protein
MAFAQNSTAFWSVGFAAGGLNYIGEVSEGGDFGTWINEMKPQFGLDITRHFNTKVSMGVQASWGKVYAADENRGNQDRNFIVDTEVAMANLIFEINFKKFGKYFQRNQSSPFIRVGGGGMFYTPFLNTNATYPAEYELYPGSWATYNFEAAFGWKWRLSYHGFLGLDLHYNTTGTSHLEGFNLKEGPNPNDAVYGLRLTYSFGFFE